MPRGIFEQMAYMANLYAEQNVVTGSKHATVSEIEVLAGLHLAVGVLNSHTSLTTMTDLREIMTSSAK